MTDDPVSREKVLEAREPRGILCGLRCLLLYDPDANGNTNRPDKPTNETIEEIASFLAERGFFGCVDITEVDDDAMHKPPCVHCHAAPPAQGWTSAATLELAMFLAVDGQLADYPDEVRAICKVCAEIAFRRPLGAAWGSESDLTEAINEEWNLEPFRKRRESAADRDERIVREAGQWLIDGTPWTLYSNALEIHEGHSAFEVSDLNKRQEEACAAAARILNRIAKGKKGKSS